jgi:hypothetical protein
VDALHSCGGAGLHVHLPTSSFPPLPPVKIPASQKQTKKTKIPVIFIFNSQFSTLNQRVRQHFLTGRGPAGLHALTRLIKPGSYPWPEAVWSRSSS